MPLTNEEKLELMETLRRLRQSVLTEIDRLLMLYVGPIASEETDDASLGGTVKDED